MRYKWHRSKKRNKIEQIESDNTTKYYPRFTNVVHKYLRDSNSFERMFPESHIDCASTMPQEMIDGINKVMGRVVIVSKNKGNNLNKTS